MTAYGGHGGEVGTPRDGVRARWRAMRAVERPWDRRASLAVLAAGTVAATAAALFTYVL